MIAEEYIHFDAATDTRPPALTLFLPPPPPPQLLFFKFLCNHQCYGSEFFRFYILATCLHNFRGTEAIAF